MPKGYPKDYVPEKRRRDYLAIEKFKRGGRWHVGVFKRRAVQAKLGKKWVTQSVKRLGLKSYAPVRTFKPISKARKMGTKNWSFYENLEGYAGKIIKNKRVQMLRVVIEGKYDGKRRVFTSYVRFSPQSRNFKNKSGADQKREYLSKVLARTALSKVRSMGYSSSPESKRNLEHDSKKAGRFFAQSIRVDSIQ